MRDQINPAIVLVAAGILFAVYPALRPYSSEVGTEGAEAVASWEWVAAHLCGIAGFILLAYAATRLWPGITSTTTLFGTALVLPYYGAETFGLYALGRNAAAEEIEPGAETIRYFGPAVATFGAGLLLLAVAGVLIARRLWADDLRVAAILVGVGLLGYLPQFFTPAPVRILHGILLGLGLLVTGIAVFTRARRAPGDTTPLRREGGASTVNP